MGPDDLKTLGVVQQVKQVHGHPILPFSTQLPETQEEPICYKLRVLGGEGEGTKSGS